MGTTRALEAGKMLGGDKWAGVSQRSPESQICRRNEGVATSRLTPPSAWYFRVVHGGPFTAMPLRSHLRNEDSVTD